MRKKGSPYYKDRSVWLDLVKRYNKLFYICVPRTDTYSEAWRMTENIFKRYHGHGMYSSYRSFSISRKALIESGKLKL